MIHRGAGISDRVKYWIRPNIENRIKSGEIRACFHSRVVHIRPDVIDLETPDGRRVFYDINANSNLRPSVAAAFGFDPFERVVDFLESELREVQS